MEKTERRSTRWRGDWGAPPPFHYGGVAGSMASAIRPNRINGSATSLNLPVSNLTHELSPFGYYDISCIFCACQRCIPLLASLFCAPRCITGNGVKFKKRRTRRNLRRSDAKNKRGEAFAPRSLRTGRAG